MHRLSVSSTISSVMNTLANAGVLVILAYVSPTILAYFGWQAAVAFAHALVMRHAAWTLLGREKKRFYGPILRGIARFSMGMTGIAFTTILLTQLDKVILSRMLPLSGLGQYTLAWTVAGGLYLLITPVFNVLYPRFTMLIKQDRIAELEALYRIGTRAFTAVLFPVAFFVAMFAQPLLRVWTHNPPVASEAAPLLSLLIIGTSLNGAMHFPYALQLASGRVRLAFFIALSLCCLLVPLLVMFAFRWHALGGALAWCLLNVLYLFYGSWLTHRRLLRGMLFKWLLVDVGVALGVTAGVVGGGALALRHFGSELPLLVTTAIATLLPIAAIALTIAFSPQLWTLFRERLRSSVLAQELQKA
jgi:O-antigen/teichoic acid export membrane protein